MAAAARTGVTGVFVKVLRYDEATRRAPTILLKFDAGATYPGTIILAARRSLFWRVISVLAKETLRKDDYLYTAPNNKHAVALVNGCIV